MKSHLTSKLLRAGLGLAVLVSLGALGQIRETAAEPAAGISESSNTNSPPAHGPNSTDKARRPTNQVGTPARSILEEILHMVEAGVSKEVLVAFLENAPIRYTPQAADLITLKQHSVPDEVTILLLKKSSESRALATPLVPAAAARTPSPCNPAYLDPESYGYFQYYYLLPRTLAWVNERLGVYPGAGFSGGHP